MIHEERQRLGSKEGCRNGVRAMILNGGFRSAVGQRITYVVY